MRKFLMALMLITILGVITACGSGGNDSSDELLFIEVEFTHPETAEVGETVELHAFVTYGEEDVTDANVVFEVWEIEDEEMENSVKFDAENNGDGSYTYDYVFEEAGTYEMYAHTDAHSQHVMPKKKIVIE